MEEQTKYALMAVGCAVMAGVGIAVLLILLFNIFWRWF